MESVTVTFTVLDPAVVGFPVIVPEFGSMANPAGRPLAVQVYGLVPPLAATVAEYGLLAGLAGSEAVVIESSGPMFSVNCTVLSDARAKWNP